MEIKLDKLVLDVNTITYRIITNDDKKYYYTVSEKLNTYGNKIKLTKLKVTDDVEFDENGFIEVEPSIYLHKSHIKDIIAVSTGQKPSIIIKVAIKAFLRKPIIKYFNLD